VFSGLCAAATDHRIEVASGQDANPGSTVIGRMVSGNYFDVLGLQPAAVVYFLQQTILMKVPTPSWCLVTHIGKTSLRILPQSLAKISV
jgi:hypothetical protein